MYNFFRKLVCALISGKLILKTSCNIKYSVTIDKFLFSKKIKEDSKEYIYWINLSNQCKCHIVRLKEHMTIWQYCNCMWQYDKIFVIQMRSFWIRWIYKRNRHCPVLRRALFFPLPLYTLTNEMIVPADSAYARRHILIIKFPCWLR